MLTDTDVSESFVRRAPDFTASPISPEARRIAAKLDAHIAEFLAGAPWKPFHHTLGISGYEANFAHPDEMFLALAYATPWLKPETAGKVREFLADKLKLARYGALVPEVADALRRHTEGCAAAHLKAFRQERNGWHMAFGDRFIGGETYTNPLHLPPALFTGAAFVEALPAVQLAGFVDVPWCRGDFYFVEKCVFALWVDAGRPWKQL